MEVAAAEQNVTVSRIGRDGDAAAPNTGLWNCVRYSTQWRVAIPIPHAWLVTLNPAV
jgi:hypothetical protein